VSHRGGTGDDLNTVSYALLVIHLEELGAATPFVPQAIAPPPVTAASRAILTHAIKRNKYQGTHRISELADASGRLAATMLETRYRGAYGKVRLAQLPRPPANTPAGGEQVVLKVMRTRAPRGRSATRSGRGPTRHVAVSQVRAEIALTGRFAPPLRFLWAHQVGAKIYAAQPRMSGTFAELLPHVSPADATPVCHSMGRQTSRYLWSMWREGHVHRDLKADNVLWNAQGDIVPSDFGLAAPWRNVRDSAGTLGYVAPELYARGSAEKADVWSWGVLMAWSFEDTHPFTRGFAGRTEALQRVASYQIWRNGFIASGLSLKDYDADHGRWSRLFRNI
ncbi:MAG TPA: protein kinase, partial [Myxococcota bacterium]|nr:protein kinase [Myxococcota bacterium]